MHEPKKFRAIMLSSTFTDLQEHRRQVREVIGKLGFKPEDMESRGAHTEGNVIESSLQMVRDSAAYVGIISHKYGQTPLDPERNPSGLSITELEFNEAMRLNRPILLFIMGDKHPVIRADVETDPDKIEKLAAFRERAKRMREGSKVERIYEVFEGQPQFVAVAATAIGRFIPHLETTEPKLRSRLARRNTVTIRNKSQATVQSRILIAALQEALDFRSRPGDNRVEPELRRQLNLDDPAAHSLFSELLEELKKLNSFLESNQRAAKIDKTVITPLSKVGLKVLNTYGKTVAVGAGLLTIGALATVLDSIGAHQVVENAMLWKHFVR